MSFWKLMYKGLREYRQERKINKIQNEKEKLQSEIIGLAYHFGQRYDSIRETYGIEELTDEEIERRLQNRHADFLEKISQNDHYGAPIQ